MVKFKNITGLTDEQVEKSRKEFGTNELPPLEVETFMQKLIGNFEDPIIRILLVALVVTTVLAVAGYADWLEGFGIAIAVFIASVVATWSEYKNEASFRDLQEQASKVQNTVFRHGTVVKVFVSEIVKGDYVLLQAGDKVPADGVLVEGYLGCVHVSLNGENEVNQKKPAPPNYVLPEGANRYHDEYLVWRESVVDDGEGVLLVQTVGTETHYGQLHKEITETEDKQSPLQEKLSTLADNVSMFGYIGASSIAVSFLFKQFVLDQGWRSEAIWAYLSLANWTIVLHDVVTALILAIIVIVVAVPEGLPMMIAIVLSLNMRKLLRDNVLVRKLSGIETAGSVNILFVDKTGTLTRGVFEPQCFVSGDGNKSESFESISPALRGALAFSLREGTSAVIGEDGVPMGGNSSDRALLRFLDLRYLKEKTETVIISELLFNSARKFSATSLKVPKANRPEFLKTDAITLIKGAPDMIVSACQTYYDQNGNLAPLKQNIMVERMDELSNQGIRLIGIAMSTDMLNLESSALPGNMSLVGIIGIQDEIRNESPEAIQLAQGAGVQVVMITGDRRETAVSVANELGLLKNGKTVLTSAQLEKMTADQIKAAIPQIGVIARALPQDKVRLVKVCRSMGLVVGMTGDGVNDSGALKKADVGFAMGSGSEVAKEASNIVILDDNFLSITRAILYGRTVFKSIRKFIVFQSTVNCASMAIVFLGPFLGFDFPLTLIQLLWVNLVMDTLAAMAFGGEPALPETMKERPIPRDQHIITPNMWSAILVNGLFIAFLCTMALITPAVRTLFVRNGVMSERVFLTAFFAYFIFLTNFNALNARTPKINVFEGVTQNRGFLVVMTVIFVVQIIFTYLGGSFLRTEGLLMSEWILIIAASVIIIPFDMCRKIFVRSMSS